ncbi:MAG: glycosyltransferase family 1 protein [Siphonobacter sp.]
MDKKILLTADQISASSTGLYHFMFELAKELKSQNPENFQFSYLIPEHLKKCKPFGEVEYRIKTKIQHIKWKTFKEFDLIHFTHQHPTILMPHKIIGKKILTIHDLNFLYEYPENSNAYRHLYNAVRRWVDHADQLTTISHYAAHDVAKILNYPIKDIRVIHNGVNIPDIPFEELDIHVPKFMPERPFLFTVGTVMFKKNFHVLPAMMSNLDYDLVIAGRIDDHAIEYYNLLMNECKRFGIASNRIHIIGETSEIDKHWYYHSCEAFVFPSIAEGFGLPVLEAFYHQRPTFLSKQTALPEVGGDAAYYFNSFHPDEMSDTVKKGISDFSNSGKAEKELARVKEFSWKKTVTGYLNLYEEMLNK